MEVRNRCLMTFTTSRNGRKIVRVNDPRPNLSRNAVNISANLLTTFDMFESSIGRLVNLVDAAVETITTETIIGEDA